ncbi:60S ribosomal protein L18a-like protein [Tanacetum coccineum]|uniref:60S ribosomal protein L18a-like protein n=1 Tax=Tanacetum coccineum TaxID=301880 RepID=A0ABQ5IRL3_9ASTR
MNPPLNKDGCVLVEKLDKPSVLQQNEKNRHDKEDRSDTCVKMCKEHVVLGVLDIVIAPGAPVLIRHCRLPYCGCGIGWFLFLVGFIFGALPWYIGAFILLSMRVDYREKPGLVVCTIGAILVLIAGSVGVQRCNHRFMVVYDDAYAEVTLVDETSNDADKKIFDVKDYKHKNNKITKEQQVDDDKETA